MNICKYIKNLIKISFGKDRGNLNSTLIQNSTCNVAKFEFLNLSPKASL
jgi:hypothetical protein